MGDTSSVDRGKAPSFKGASAVGDYANIGVPKDGMGYDVGIQAVKPSLSAGGNANYTEPVRQVGGSKKAM